MKLGLHPATCTPVILVLYLSQMNPQELGQTHSSRRLSIQRVAAPAYLDILQVGPELQVFCPDTCNAGNDHEALAERTQRPFDNACTAVAVRWQGLLLALSASAVGH